MKLDKDAIVEGDVEAQFLASERGATFQGQFIVLAEQKHS